MVKPVCQLCKMREKCLGRQGFPSGPSQTLLVLVAPAGAQTRFSSAEANVCKACRSEGGGVGEDGGEENDSETFLEGVDAAGGSQACGA